MVFLLLLSLARGAKAQATEGPAQIRDINIVRDGNDLKIEVTLTTSVEPTIIVANNPDRLVMDLANTTADAKQKHLPVDWKGIAQVRIGLNRPSPPTTRLVVDLDREHPYSVLKTGNKVVLTVLPAGHVSASNRPAPAVGGGGAPLFGVLLGRKKSSLPSDDTPTPTPIPVEPRQPEAVAKDEFRTVFKVKAVAEGEAYLDGGRRSGLKEGMTLTVRDSGASSRGATANKTVAELRVISVAEDTAVTTVQSPQRDVRPGDLAYLAGGVPPRDTTAVAESEAPTVPAQGLVPMAVRTPPPPEPQEDRSRMRGRIGFDNSGFRSTGSTPGSSNTMGFMVRSDMTNILGTHWNVQGYWRVRFTKSVQPLQQQMEYYLDKGYIMQAYYDNADSNWVGGVGRLYLPWATVLDTIDGAYIGRKVGEGTTVAGFVGSIPDINTWHYSPNQRIVGGLVNFDGGSYDAFHYSSTTGVAINTIKWRMERPEGFLENKLSYKKLFSVYHTFVVDDQQGLTTDGIAPGAGISRSYVTFHTQPLKRLGFDIVHNYFRDVPTISTAVISTGMVDKLIFQGTIGIAHLQATKHLTLYTELAHSKKTGDAHRALDQLFGITWTDLGSGNTHLDYRYSQFASPFATGTYHMLSFSRYFGNRILWDMQVGHQDLVSTFTANKKSTYFDTSFDVSFGKHSYLQSGYTISRGDQLNYYQWYTSLGYRFDLKPDTKPRMK